MFIACLHSLQTLLHARHSLVENVENLSARQETQVQSLGQEDSLEKEMATLFSIIAWRIPWTADPVGYSSWGHKESDMTKQLTLSFMAQTWEWPITNTQRAKTYIHIPGTIAKSCASVISLNNLFNSMKGTPLFPHFANKETGIHKD